MRGTKKTQWNWKIKFQRNPGSERYTLIQGNPQIHNHKLIPMHKDQIHNFDKIFGPNYRSEPNISELLDGDLFKEWENDLNILFEDACSNVSEKDGKEEIIEINDF